MRMDSGISGATGPTGRQTRFMRGKLALMPLTLIMMLAALMLSSLAGCGLGASQDSAAGPFASASAVITAIATAPLAPQRIYLGTRAGIFMSEDAGQHWPTTPLATFGGAGIRAIAASAIDTHTLWVVTGEPPPAAGTTPSASPQHSATTTTTTVTPTPHPTFPATPRTGASGAVWVSHDGGSTWHWAATHLPGQVTAIWAGTASANSAWAAVLGGGLWLTNDDGLDWTAAGGLPQNTVPRTLLGADTTGASILLGTSAGLLRSTDGGKHWSSVGDVRGSVIALAAAPLARRTIYSLTDLGIYRSTDGGAHFTAQSYGLPDTALAVGTNPDVLFALAGVNIHRSTDGGHTWTLLQTATTSVAGIAVLPPASALATPSATNSMTVSRGTPTASPSTPPIDTVFVALSKPAGALVSRDGGLSWNQQGG